MSRTQLAKLVGLTQGGITRILDGEQESSARVPAICDALGVPVPAAPVADEVVDLVQALDPADREIALTFLRRLKQKK